MSFEKRYFKDACEELVKTIEKLFPELNEDEKFDLSKRAIHFIIDQSPKEILIELKKQI